MFNSIQMAGIGVLGLLLVAPLQAASVDPTRPPSAKAMVSGIPSASKPRPLVLQSIRISEQQRRAVISGIKVAEGSRIQGAKVVSIDPGHVLLQQGNKQIRLALAGRAIKQFKQEQK